MSPTEHVLLVKSPARGAVKRRLAAGTGPVHATALYRAFVLDMLSAFEDASVTPVICHHPPGAAGAIRRWLGPRYRLRAQRGRDHPGRLMHAFEDLFRSGADRVLVFASDLPDLPARIIKQAARALDKSEAVLGPGADGGYYVIGFQRESFLPEAFVGLAWSTGRTFRQTVGKLRLAGRSLAFLPRWQDIDTPEDLAGLFRRNRRTAFRHSRTMEYCRARLGSARRRFDSTDRTQGAAGDG